MDSTVPTIRDCSHKNVMRAWEKVSPLFHAFRFVAARLANLSQYNSVPIGCSTHPFYAKRQQPPSTFVVFWSCDVGQRYAISHIRMGSHKNLIQPSRKIILQQSPQIPSALGNGTNGPLWVPLVVHNLFAKFRSPNLVRWNGDRGSMSCGPCWDITNAPNLDRHRREGLSSILLDHDGSGGFNRVFGLMWFLWPYNWKR